MCDNIFNARRVKVEFGIFATYSKKTRNTNSFLRIKISKTIQIPELLSKLLLTKNVEIYTTPDLIYDYFIGDTPSESLWK